MLRDVLETHRMEVDNGAPAEDLAAWVKEEHPNFDWQEYGFQEFSELLNYAQDKMLVRVSPTEEQGSDGIPRARISSAGRSARTRAGNLRRTAEGRSATNGDGTTGSRSGQGGYATAAHATKETCCRPGRYAYCGAETPRNPS